jgi:hypothetical protein
MRNLASTITVMVMALAAATPVAAAPPQDFDFENEVRGWTFYGRFRVFPGDSGLIMKADPSLGYTFNEHFEVYAGLPVYFVRESSTAVANPASMTGIGNAYAGLQLSLLNPVVDFTSNLELTAPTGDESRGFSTGRVTADWTNTFSRTFGSVMPYASAGVANTVSDTSFFVRPFTSDGLVGHFELGGLWDVTRRVTAGMAGYGVRASGEQRILSRVIQNDTADAAATRRGAAERGTPTEGRSRVFLTAVDVIGLAEIANDEGFATWLTIRPQRNMDLQIGYNVSTRYDLDSLFVGIGFRVGK